MPGKSKKGGGLEVGSAYKMKGFSGFGNSPLKDPGHGGKKGHVHFGSKGTTKKVVDIVKKKAKDVYEDPIGETYRSTKKGVKAGLKGYKKYKESQNKAAIQVPSAAVDFLKDYFKGSSPKKPNIK